ncbi:glycerol dehydrogenase [Sphingobium xenophagum]|jgi:glycerol dehydrogenase|uniref:glycerol dehydrogenase n=1 Tax=Sphingobium xenophagum TaxID=121428 RepID=UPI00102FF04F|nr:glycerol dehydrogenase [Sphingobium xenophagum]
MAEVPIQIFGDDHAISAPRVFFAAHRYVQGPGVLGRLCRYLPLVKSIKPAILYPVDLPESILYTVKLAFEGSSTSLHWAEFGGQCSHEEIDRQVAALRPLSVDSLIAIGGGKVIDAAKCVAHRLGVALIVCPTLASTDAPCSAAAVVYTAEGVFKDVEFFPGNPDLVVVDTAIIAKAPLRFLLAGMADALATGYEARTCIQNTKARSMVGGRISIAASTLANICSETIFTYADDAVAAAKAGIPDHAFEQVVEANTLLSGTGFESGGLAAAHSVASALTLVPSIEHGFLHGEMVAVGTMIHLQLENDLVELERVEELLARLGLPRALSDLGVEVRDGSEALDTIVDAACSMPFMQNEPFTVTASLLRNAITAVEVRRQSQVPQRRDRQI